MERFVLPPYDGYDLSTFVRVGSSVHIGHVGGTTDESGARVTTIEEQFHRTLDSLETMLSEIDLTLADVAKLRVILADIEDFAAMHEVWTDRFEPGGYPARTVVTSAFVDDAILVQVEGVAGIDE